MKYIGLIAVAAVVLLQFSDVVPKGSVGGSMTIAVAFLAAALAVGIYEAWSKRRGVLGWIVSIVVAVIGAIVAGLAGGTLVDMIMAVAATHLNIEGSLADTRHPLLYILAAAMMLFTLFGSWLALSLVNRMR